MTPANPHGPARERDEAASHLVITVRHVSPSQLETAVELLVAESPITEERARTPDWTVAASAYDALAPRYDEIPRENRINAYMRRISMGRLAASFRPGMRVLELGCGTGEEAIALATRGVRVVALDPSEEMVKVARSKAGELRVSDRVTFLCAPARDLGRLAGELGAFDGAYASFSLAYEPDLAPVAGTLHILLAPGATFLASVPSRLCLVEFALALAGIRPGLAGRRLRRWHGHKVGTHRVPIRTYTPNELARAMSPNFVLGRVEALPFLVPPPYMNVWYARFPVLAKGFERTDAILRGHFPFRSLGDHFLAEFQHRGILNAP